MYESISTHNDVAKEGYLYGADLCGTYGFPKIQPVHVSPESLRNLRAVPFSSAGQEKRPRECVCHFFVDDARFERIWNNCDKYLPILKNFKYVITPDFSSYSNMPLALQIYQTYRNRVLAHYLYMNGIDIIPCVGWSDEKSFEYCFDSLPKNSTLAVSTNGCFSKDGKEFYKKGFLKMCRRLEPETVVIIGREIPVDTGAEVIYLRSFGQDMSERLKNGR